MKKLIAFGLAIAMLLFAGAVASNTSTQPVLNAKGGIQVCEDIEPDPHPHSDCM